MRVFLAGLMFATPEQHWPHYLAWFCGVRGPALERFDVGHSTVYVTPEEMTAALEPLKMLPQVRELTSYLDASKSPSTWRKLMTGEPIRLELMLDSGAFSAWTRNVVISIEEYAAFILANPGVFDVVVNLDVIPGKPGRLPSSADVEKAAEQGWENWGILTKKLKPLKLQPLHAYHYGEDIKWLKRIMDQTDYLAIGGIAAGLTTSERMAWLDSIMPVLTDDKGYPIRKFHGFGVTSVDILLRYPWYSVDSTSWVLTGRFGGVYIPLNGKIHKVTFSTQSSKTAVEGQHWTTYTKPEQRAIIEYLTRHGFTPEELAVNYVRRDEANIQFFLDLERNWVSKPWKRVSAQPSLF